MPSRRARSAAAVTLLAATSAFIGCAVTTPDEDAGTGGALGTGGAAGAATGGTTSLGGTAGSENGATGGTLGGFSGGAGQATGGVAAQAGVAGSSAGTAGIPMGGTSGASGASGGAAGTTAGNAGSGPGGSSGSNAGGSGGAGMGSPGCGKATTQMARQWIEATPLDVSGAMRHWWTYLPNNYDPMRRYPVVFLFHGCGTETNNVPMQNVVGENAILVRSKAVGECWVTDTNSANVAFFDALVTAVNAALCVDTTRRFAVGYSSGSWLINTLECVRGGVLRAAASVAGGSPRRNAGACMGPTLARLFVHDTNDPDNAISGSIVERDRLLTANGCTTAAPVAEDPSPCARYQGCMPGLPVIWCETMGQMHGRQDQLASTAAWGLFTEF